MKNLIGITAAVSLCLLQNLHTAPRTDDWPAYGHDPGGMRFSPLADVTRSNVSQLRIAWTYHTGDASAGGGLVQRSGFEATPIVVDGTMYLSTATNRIVA